MISLFVLFACGVEKSDVESDCPAYEDAETVYDVQRSISITIDNDEHSGLEITLE